MPPAVGSSHCGIRRLCLFLSGWGGRVKRLDGNLEDT